MPRLRHVTCSSPGLSRRRRGRGFEYLDERGRPLRDPVVLERIRALAIPPAWRDVWICSDADGHLQAVGTDDAGRRQYLYHPRWRAHRDRAKFESMLDFAKRLPPVRRKVEALLADGDELGRERVLALAVGLLDRGLFRIGGEEYTDVNGSYGLATLERRHVTLGQHGVLVFDYEGKTGKRLVREVADPAMYRVAAELKRARRRNPSFLAYRNGRGWVDVRSNEINLFVKELAGEQFSAKDFRTWHATVLAALAVASAEPPKSGRGRKRVEVEAIRRVAELLGNTPAVARASYIDPRVFDRFDDGVTIAPALRRIRLSPGRPFEPAAQQKIEVAVRRLLLA